MTTLLRTKAFILPTSTGEHWWCNGQHCCLPSSRSGFDSRPMHTFFFFFFHKLFNNILFSFLFVLQRTFTFGGHDEETEVITLFHPTVPLPEFLFSQLTSSVEIHSSTQPGTNQFQSKQGLHGITKQHGLTQYYLVSTLNLLTLAFVSFCTSPCVSTACYKCWLGLGKGSLVPRPHLRERVW